MISKTILAMGVIGLVTSATAQITGEWDTGKPWLGNGEYLSTPMNQNGDFREGTKPGSHLGRADGWINELTSGETSGYWQTPEGPTEKNTRFLYCNRGYKNWSAEEVRIVPAKPPIPSGSYDGYSLELFPYLNDRPRHVTVSYPAIGVRQGEASCLAKPFKIDGDGALLLQVSGWVPNHGSQLGNDKPMRPSFYATVDLDMGQTSVGAQTEIRVPVDLGAWEKWKRVTVRLEWHTILNRTWFEWRVWNPDGKLILPTSASAETRCTENTASGTEPYPYLGWPGHRHWSAVAVLDHSGPKWKALEKNGMVVTPKIIVGSWLAVESTYPYYPMCGEAYINNVKLRTVEDPITDITDQ